jgi:hypothetical protein
MPSGSVFQPSANEQPFSRLHWRVIIAATVVAAVMRFYGLGEWSLWIDEAHTWRDATMPLGGEDGFLSEQRRLYPLSFFLLRLLFGMGAIGFDEWSLRLPFCLIGILTVPILAICGRSLVGAWPAVIAACLLAINPWHLYWSQNARGYSIVLLGSVLATHRLFALYKSGAATDLVLSALFILLGTASHPTAFIIVFGFAGFLFVRRCFGSELRVRTLVVVAIVVLLVTLAPWFVEHYTPFSDFLKSKKRSSLAHWLTTVVYYFRPSVLLAFLVALIVAPPVIGAARTLFLGSIVVLPMLALTAIGSQLVQLTARYGLFMLPAITLMVGLLICDVARRVRATSLSQRGAWALAAVLPLLLCGDYLQLDFQYYANRYGDRGRWREASEFLLAQSSERGLRGLRVLTVNYPSVRYYLRPRHWFVGDADPHPDMAVEPIVRFRFALGMDASGRKRHDPGVDAFIAWERKKASEGEQLLAVLVKLPYLREKDTDGSLQEKLERDFELALYLPSWAGPKDNSIYVYLPKAGS